MYLLKVESGGKADIAGVKVGDHVIEINEKETGALYHTEALAAVKKAQYSLSLVLFRYIKVLFFEGIVAKSFLLILSEFKQLDKVLFPPESSENPCF